MTYRTLLVPLPGGKDIAVIGDFPLTEPEWIQLMHVLEVMKPGLVKSEPDTQGDQQ
jgi:hypothetical protein